MQFVLGLPEAVYIFFTDTTLRTFLAGLGIGATVMWMLVQVWNILRGYD